MKKKKTALLPAIPFMLSFVLVSYESDHSNDYPYFWTGTSANFTRGEPYYYAWCVAFGRAADGDGQDTHGAGAVRFDTKYEGGPLAEGGEPLYNHVRLVRD